MTLEEKAKEYAHNNYEILIDTNDAFVTSEDYLEQGYLAGAKETTEKIWKMVCENNDFLIERLKDIFTADIDEIRLSLNDFRQKLYTKE